ncbi:MAG: nitroreductase family protein [Candidatus Helarchaeota archaeon]|nr:nitroreductase family protein [Candidatus Helarchaeota archaeon]
MKINDALMLRASVKSFKPEREVAPDVMEAIYDAARWAPSPENVQHVRFIIIKDEQIKSWIAQMSREIREHGRTRVPAPLLNERLKMVPPEIRPLYMEKMTNSEAAGDIIETCDTLVLAIGNGNWYDTPYLVAPPEFGGIVCATAIQNMWTSAVGNNIGMSLVTQPFASERNAMLIKDRLGIPHDWELFAGLCFGVAEKRNRLYPTARAPKIPLERLVFDGYWGRQYKRMAFKDDLDEKDYMPPDYNFSMDVFDSIYLRRSIRTFKEKHDVYEQDGGGKIPEWKIEALLEAARNTASMFNAQNFRFVLLREPRDHYIKEKLGHAALEMSKYVFGMVPWNQVADRLWYIPKHTYPGIMEYMADGSLMYYPTRANAIIIPCVQPAYNGEPIGRMGGTNLASIFVSMAIQNMWNLCPVLGLGIGFNALTSSDIRRRQLWMEELGIPGSWMMPACLGIGIPATPRNASPPRFPVSSLFFNEYWGKPYKRIAFRD